MESQWFPLHLLSGEQCTGLWLPPAEPTKAPQWILQKPLECTAVEVTRPRFSLGREAPVIKNSGRNFRSPTSGNTRLPILTARNQCTLNIHTVHRDHRVGDANKRKSMDECCHTRSVWWQADKHKEEGEQVRWTHVNPNPIYIQRWEAVSTLISFSSLVWMEDLLWFSFLNPLRTSLNLFLKSLL